LEETLRRHGHRRAAARAPARGRNRRLKQVVADLTLDKQMLQEVLQKKV